LGKSMRSSQRKIIALIADKILGSSNPKMIYDHESEEYSEFKISASKKGFVIKDIKQDVEVIVEKKPIKWHIFCTGTGKYIDLEIFNDYFRGYDYGSSKYFTIYKEGSVLKIYDNETDDYHYYSME